MGRTFGARIVAARKKAGLTQVELAAQLGVNELTLWRWEKDKTFPSGRNLVRLTDFLEGRQ